jgi:hypothetical protein
LTISESRFLLLATILKIKGPCTIGEQLQWIAYVGLLILSLLLKSFLAVSKSSRQFLRSPCERAN